MCKPDCCGDINLCLIWNDECIEKKVKMDKSCWPSIDEMFCCNAVKITNCWFDSFQDGGRLVKFYWRKVSLIST